MLKVVCLGCRQAVLTSNGRRFRQFRSSAPFAQDSIFSRASILFVFFLVDSRGFVETHF